MTEPMHTPPEPDEVPERNPRMALLIGLGGLTAIAVILLAVRAAAKPRSTQSYAPMGDVPEGAEWLPTFQHFADAVEVRFAGVENRLNDLANQRVQAAHVSEPAPPLIPQPDPIAANGAAQAAHVSEEVSEVPPPAAVSLPDVP